MSRSARKQKPTDWYPWALGAHVFIYSDESLRNLNRIRRSAFANLIPTNKHLDPAPILTTDILPDAPHQHIILPARFQGHREVIVLAIVHDLHPRCFRQVLAHLLGGDRALELQVDRFAVRARDRNANA